MPRSADRNMASRTSHLERVAVDEKNGRGEAMPPYILDSTEKPSNLHSAADEENALERSPTPLTPPAASTMDGGPRAWLQVLGSFLVFGNLWGMTFAFGYVHPSATYEVRF